MIYYKNLFFQKYSTIFVEYSELHVQYQPSAVTAVVK